MYYNVSCMPVVTITIKHYNALETDFTVCGLSMKSVYSYDRRRMKRIISGNHKMTHREATLSRFHFSTS